MKKTDRLTIAIHVNAYVSGMFAMFQNKANVGPNFTWEKFPDMMRKNSFMPLMNCGIEVLTDEHKQLAGEYADQEARRLVKMLSE